MDNISANDPAYTYYKADNEITTARFKKNMNNNIIVCFVILGVSTIGLITLKKKK